VVLPSTANASSAALRAFLRALPVAVSTRSRSSGVISFPLSASLMPSLRISGVRLRIKLQMRRCVSASLVAAK
jgi:hypothetical protein